MEYFAHIDEDDRTRKHPLHKHLYGTAEKAECFAPPALKGVAWLAGLLHDVGKYQKSFQERLNGKSIRVEHSHCGALWAVEQSKQGKLKPLVAYALAYCIAGHHGGLPNGGVSSDSEDVGTLLARLKRTTEDYFGFSEELDIMSSLKECDKWLEDLNAFANSHLCNPQNKKVLGELYSFDLRMLYSALTDADFLDTELFCKGKQEREMPLDLKKCLKKVEEKLNSFEQDTKIKRSRAALQRQAAENAKKDANVYLMNMPTGSGKTLGSLYVALLRAVKTGKNRIIYVIPYTSIIEQTANEFEKIFGKGMVLQHHSSYDFDGDERENNDISHLSQEKARRSAENWDASIIVTTNVAFFESIYSCRVSKLRRLHNMQDSILVFDEVHMMQADYLAPCLKAVSYLTTRFGSEALFLTATMPDFQEVFHRHTDINIKVCNLILDTVPFIDFQSCVYHILNETSDERIVELASKHKNALIVVNSRRRAREIFQILPKPKYHLSTYLTPFDRSRLINRIRDDLKKNLDITVVSTSLIEAGVDLDFSCVFRELSGLDSVLQAGGRCNREGNSNAVDSPVYVFGESGKASDISVRQNITKGIISRFGEKLSAPDAIIAYYNELYDYKKRDAQSHDMQNEIEFLKSKLFFSIGYRNYADGFSLIDSSAVSVVIPLDNEAKSLVDGLRFNGAISIKRKLQRYCASVFQNELRELIAQGAAEDYGTGLYVLKNLDSYDENLGLKTTNEKIYFIERC